VTCAAVNVLTRPRALSHDTAAAALVEGVRAYTALHLQARGQIAPEIETFLSLLIFNIPNKVLWV
jgi:hypothetical protein